VQRQRARSRALEQRREPARRSALPADGPITCAACGSDRVRLSTSQLDRGPGQYLHVWHAALGFECAACGAETMFSFMQRDDRIFMSRFPA
jgi:hypothetical protein